MARFSEDQLFMDDIVDHSFLIDPDLIPETNGQNDYGFGTSSSPTKSFTGRHQIFDIRSPSPDPQKHQYQANTSFQSNGQPGYASSVEGTPSKRKAKALALKEQEKIINELKKENFSLKLKIFFLEDRMTKLTPENLKDAYKENVELKVESETLRAEIENYKRLLMESHQAIDALRSASPELAKQDLTNGSFRKELSDTKRIMIDQASELERLREQSKTNNEALFMARQRIRELDETLERQKLEAHAADPMLENTIVQYRKDIERLEMELGKTKTQLFNTNSSLAQRSVEVEQLRGANESLTMELNSKSPNRGGMGAKHGDVVVDARHMHNQQMEQGISLLRDQISELKLQLIEKTASADHLMLELEAKNQAHARSIQQSNESWSKEETKLKGLINELREQLNLERSEIKRLAHELEQAQQTYRIAETNYQIEVQHVQHQLKLKEQSNSHYLQEKDKLRTELKRLEHEVDSKTNLADNLGRQLETKVKLVEEAEKAHQQLTQQFQNRLSAATSQIAEKTMEVESKEAELRQLREQLERQSKHVVQVEERWALQSRDLGQQQKHIREELEQQIRTFREKIMISTNQLQQKETEVAELRSQLNMHSIGMEEALKMSNQERDQVKQELQTARREAADVQQELNRRRHQLEDLNSAYNDTVAANAQLSEDIQIRDLKLKKQYEQLLEVEELVRAKEKELKDKTKAMESLKQKVANSEHVLAEGKHVVDEIDKTYRTQLDERNKLLIRIQTVVDTLLTDEQRISVSMDSTHPSSGNFFTFSDVLLEKITLVSKIASRFEQKLKSTELNFTDEFNTLNKKLDRKVSQLEKFEGIIREVTEIQKALKRSIKAKQQEVNHAKTTITSMEHEIAVQKHHISTLQSASTVFSASEKAKLLDANGKIAELERALRSKENKLSEEHLRLAELEERHGRERAHAQKLLEEATDELREQESQAVKSQQLEKLVDAYKKSLEEATANHSSIHRRSSPARSVMDASDSAIASLNGRLKEEVDSLRHALDREKQRLATKEDDYRRLSSDYQKIKRRLHKRETMIEIALSKLEMVNSRKDYAELSLVHQFTDDVRSMLKRADSTMLSDDTFSLEQSPSMARPTITSTAKKSSLSQRQETMDAILNRLASRKGSQAPSADANP